MLADGTGGNGRTEPSAGAGAALTVAMCNAAATAPATTCLSFI